MTRFAGMWFTIAIFAVSTGLLAQEPLPKTLDGTWRGVSTLSRHSAIAGSMSVTIDKQNPDGSIEGRMTFNTLRCNMADDPIAGHFDGQVLTLKAGPGSKSPKDRCGPSNFVLKKGADGHFEGESPGNSSQIKASLAPK